MSLLLHDNELLELLQNFYILTGMTISLFDENYKGVFAYPSISRTFCNCMKGNKCFQDKCREDDRKSFAITRKTKKLEVHQCHAGLMEATAPIIKNGKIIGYLMFGQITTQKNKEPFRAKMLELCNEYGVEDDLTEEIKKIKSRSHTQIQAAAKILEACSEYIQLKELVHLSERRTVNLVEDFVKKHISEEITVERLCNEFNISRTQLYNLTRQYVSGGIAAFVRQIRMQTAKKLIRTTDTPITEIANAVGFADYNYFMKVFKQTFGLSPKKMLKDLYIEQ